MSSVSNRRDKNGLCVCVSRAGEIQMLNTSQKLSQWAPSEKSEFFPVFRPGLGTYTYSFTVLETRAWSVKVRYKRAFPETGYCPGYTTSSSP